MLASRLLRLLQSSSNCYSKNIGAFFRVSQRGRLGGLMRGLKCTGACIGLVLLAIANAASASANTITVTNSNDAGPGSLRDAIATAASGDTVDFSLTYPATIVLASTLTINTSLTISGPGASSVLISGNQTVQVLSIGGGITVTISGVTIENGSSSVGRLAYNVNAYGGLYNAGTLTLSNSTISGNSANVGDLGYVVNACGGLYNVGTMTISNSTISGNSATFTKGAYVSNAYGGLYNSGTMTISNTTISGNAGNIGDLGGSSVNGYAGLYNSGTMTINNSTISGNSATLGADEYYTNGYGGLYNSGALALTNSTISGNSANVGALPTNSSGYGGLYNAKTLTLSNSTVSGNSASVGSLPSNSAAYGGIFNGGTLTGLITKNSILANNPSGGNCAGTFTSQGYNLSDDASCAASFTQTGDLNSTPAGLDPGGLKDNGGPTQTIALLAGSPAVDAVPLSPIYYCTDTSGNPVASDQRAVTRPQGSACDIGAFELAQTQTSTLPQSVSFTTTAPASAIYNSTFPVAAQSTSGLTVTLSLDSGSTSVCAVGTPSVAGGMTSATVTMLSGTGSCTIFALQPGNASYLPASLQQTTATALQISQAAVTVTGPASVTYGTTGTATAIGGSGTGPVTYSAGASTGCSVSGTAVSVGNAAGTCSLTATKAADNNYTAATSAAFPVALAKAPATIVVTPYNVTYDGTAHTAVGTVTGVGSVDLSSQLTLTGTAHTNAGSYLTDPWTFTDVTGNYINASGTVSDTIAKAPATLTLSNLSQYTNGTLRPATVTTNPNGLTGVSVTYTGTGGTVFGPTAAPPTNAGTYTADASLINTNYQASDAIGTLTITQLAVVSISLAPVNPSIALGSTQQFTATGTYNDSSTQDVTATVTWASATPSVATIVANTGLATTTGIGTSQITATLGGVKSTSDTLTVVNPAPVISNLSPLHSPAGAGFTLSVNGSGFVSASTVSFNGKTEATTFGSGTQLMAAIPVADNSRGGKVNVTVTNPAPGGGISTVSNFTIDDFGIAGPSSPVNVMPGPPTPVTISITPTSNGFANAIQLIASGLPKATTAQFSQDPVTTGLTTTHVTMTVTATAVAALPAIPVGKNFPAGPMGLLAAILAAGLLVIRKRVLWGEHLRARTAAFALWLLVIGGLGASLGGCATSPQTTPVGTYAVTVTAMSGSVQHTTTVTLNIQ
jgi:hypothetical protein